LMQRTLRKPQCLPDITQDTYFGDLVSEKDPDNLRVVFNNPNGLTYTPTGEDYKYIHSTAQDLQADVVGLAEVNSPFSQHFFLRQLFKSTSRLYTSQVTVQFSSADALTDKVPMTETYQAGGTATVVYGRWTTYVEGEQDKSPDSLGRWSTTILRGKANQSIAIVTAYRVCGGSITNTTEGTSFYREYMFYRDKGQCQPNPRKEMIRDLTDHITKLQQQGHLILVMMDANEEISPRSNLNHLIHVLGLVDVHSHSPAPSTHIRGSQRIDYMLVSASLIPFVTRSGTLAYHQGFQTDHRTLYCDISSDFFITSPALIGPGQVRTLRSGNPELTATYRQALRTQFLHQNIFQRVARLEQTFCNLTTDHVRRLLNQLDTDITRSMLHAERCLHRTPRKYAFSPALRNAGLIKRYWSIRLFDARQNTWSESRYNQIARTIQKHDPDFQLPQLNQRKLPKPHLEHQFNLAAQQYRQLSTQAQSLRELSLQDLLQRYLSDEDPTTHEESRRRAKIVERTMRTESLQAYFKEIGNQTKTHQSGSVTKLLIPHHKDPQVDQQYHPEEVFTKFSPSDIVWEHVLDKETIERELLTFNRRSFRKAAASPCGHGVIHDSLGFHGLNPAATSVLDGVIPPNWNIQDPILLEFFKSFARPPQAIANPINSEITLKDFADGVKGWHESTSTSPSGRHLGHYKALLEEQDLLEPIATVTNLAVQSGVALDRWSNAVNVMLEKTPGWPNICKLRIIHLFEADYNLFLKLVWGKRLIQQAGRLNLIHPQQHARPKRTCIQPIMLRQLTFDLCRQTKKDLALFDLDATACYDRIIVCLAMMAARKCGMPEGPVSTHAEALRFMKYTVKTVYGISEENYQGTPLEPLFGTGQGSGGSPAAWLTLIVLLLQAIDRLVPDRMTFVSPDGTLTSERLSDVYVDDANLGRTSESETYAEQVAKLQLIVQTWERLLFYSGGALNLQKCFYYVMHWQWDRGKPELYSPTADDPQLQLVGGNDPTAHLIPCRPNAGAERTLGAYISPSGDSAEQLRQLRRKAIHMSAGITRARISPQQARTWHDCYYFRSVGFPLPTLATDEENLEPVQTPIISPLLQKLGYNRNMPREVVFGPKTLGGINLFNLKTEYGVEAISFLQDSLYRRDDVGIMLLISIQTSQLEAGISTPLLSAPHIYIPYLTPTWVLSVRQFMYNHGLSLRVTETLKLTPTCPDDACIMDVALSLTLTQQELQTINLVRMYFQVVFISDIAAGCGTQVHEAFYTKHCPLDRASTLTWPRQPLITEQQLRRWTNFLELQITRTGSRFLRNPLSKPGPSQHMKWIYGTDINRSIIYDTKTHQCARVTGVRRNHGTIGTWWSSVAQPHKLLPVSLAGTRIRFHDNTPMHPPKVSAPNFHSFTDYCGSLSAGEQELLHQSNVHVSITDLNIALRHRKRKLYLATDGGLKHYNGTYAWRLLDHKKRLLANGGGHVHGNSHEMSSLRSELGGIAAPLLWLYHYQIFSGIITKGRLVWFCDSKSALKKIVGIRNTHRYHLPDHADLLYWISLSLKGIRCRITGTWVKSHQDDTKPFEDLSFAAQQNVLVDIAASDIMEQSTSHDNTAAVLALGSTLYIQGHRVASHARDQLHMHIDGYPLRRYLQRHNRWNQNVFDSIDWPAFTRHIRPYQGARHRRRVQFIHRWNNTGLQKAKLTKTLVDDHLSAAIAICPCCKSEPETHDHLFFCTALAAKRHSLRQYLQASHGNTATHTGQAAFQQCIQAWLRGDTPTQPHHNFSHLKGPIDEAIHAQTKIGWGNAFRGFLGTKWTTAFSISHYSSAPQDYDTGLNRSTSILHNLALFVEHLWQERNDILHRSNDETGRKAAHTLQNATIDFLYTRSEEVLAGDRHLFHRPRLRTQMLGSSMKRRWIRSARQALHRARNQRAAGQTQLTSFFPTIRSSHKG
jgi:hypothetical protein